MSYNSKEIKVVSTAKSTKTNPYKKDVILDPAGQWKYPGQVTKIPNRNITMKGVNYPVLGVDDLGNKQMIYPDMDYTFPGESVTEYPQMQQGGDPGMRGMMKARMAYANEFGNPSARRMVSPDPKTGITPEGLGTHYMASMGDWVVPLLQDKGGKNLTYNKNPRPSSEDMKFDRPEDAEYFAEHYKEIAPMMRGWLDNYAGGGSPSPEKAAAMLKDGTAHGYPLTDKQIAFFKSIAGDLEEEYKKGGQYRALRRNKTSRNLKTSLNYLMARNYNLYGLPGQRFYDPDAKFEDGGFNQYNNLTTMNKEDILKMNMGGPLNMFNAWAPDFANPEFLMKMGGNMPCFNCGGMYKMQGGGLSRDEDYGSKKKPYPSVDSSDFAGGHRSYPIPTHADAVDALRLAGLHGREDVKAKVYAKYPDLKQNGGAMTSDLQGQYPMFNQGGYDYMYGGDPSLPALNSKDSLSMFRDVIKKMGGPTYPGQTQGNIIETKKNDFLHYIRNNTMDAIARDENNAMHQMPDGSMMRNDMMQIGGGNMQDYRTDAFQNKFNPYMQNINPYGFNPNMQNQNAFMNAANQGQQNFQNDMGNFFNASQNLGATATPYTQTNITQAQDGLQVILNPATKQPYSKQEWEELKRQFQSTDNTQQTQQTQQKITPWYQRSGMNYFPMNYEPSMKISDRDVKTMQMLQQNPSSNLKEFHAKKRLFGPGVRRIDMVFGAKDQLPEFKAEEQMRFQDKTGMDASRQSQFAAATPVDQPVFTPPTRISPGGFGPQSYMEGILRGDPNVKAYGGLTKYQDRGQVSFDPGTQYYGQPSTGVPGYNPYMSTSNTIEMQGKTMADIAGTGPKPLSGNTLPQGQEHLYNVTEKFKRKYDPEAMVNWGLAGGNALASILELPNAWENERKFKSMQSGDNQFYNQKAGNRGDYNQFGIIRPDQKVPVQFAGQNYGQAGSPYQFQEGGEYFMTDDQVNAILKAGGQIEYLD